MALNQVSRKQDEEAMPKPIFANRHISRNDGSKPSIDFIYHTSLKGPRQASDGGIFPTHKGGRSANAPHRLGTAESGHGRQFLVTDFSKNVKNPHFSKDWA